MRRRSHARIGSVADTCLVRQRYSCFRSAREIACCECRRQLRQAAIGPMHAAGCKPRILGGNDGQKYLMASAGAPFFRARPLAAAGAAGFRSGPAFAQATQGVTDNEILIGALGQLTGPFAFIGAPGRDNMQLAIEKINEAGGDQRPQAAADIRACFDPGRGRGRGQEAHRKRQGVRAGHRDRQHGRGGGGRLCPRRTASRPTIR